MAGRAPRSRKPSRSHGTGSPLTSQRKYGLDRPGSRARVRRIECFLIETPLHR